MSGRIVPFVKGVALSAVALLLMAPQVSAGGGVRAAKPTITPPQPAPTPVFRAPQAVTVAVTLTQPAQPAVPPLAVNLRGPDGQVRRFAVEGGRDVIQVRSVVLRPGESLTIQWQPAK